MSNKSISALTALVISATAISSCSKDDKESTTSSSTGSALADSENPGAAVTEINAALGSLALTLPIGLHLAGLATDYCNANGDPKKDGTEIQGNSEAIYASAIGFCQATFNSQSPDTARGAMYLAGGIACEVGAANLLDGIEVEDSKSETITVDFGTDCWGTQAEADAFKEDTGSDSLELPVTVARLATTAEFDYKISFAVGEGQEIELLIKSGNGIRAARMTESNGEGGSAFAVTLDASDLSKAKISFEKISLANEGRTRVLVQGKMDEDLKFEEVESVEGFELRGQEGGDSVSLSTFSGNTTTGLMGASYSPVAVSDGTGSCYLPGVSSATCAGATVIASSLSAAETLMSAASDAQNALAAYEKVLNLSAVDPDDVDVTQ